jgi:hypothetical protein
VLMVLVSLVTPPPSRVTIEKYFPERAADGADRPERPKSSGGARTAAPLHQPSS